MEAKCLLLGRVGVPQPLLSSPPSSPQPSASIGFSRPSLQPYLSQVCGLPGSASICCSLPPLGTSDSCSGPLTFPKAISPLISQETGQAGKVVFFF